MNSHTNFHANRHFEDPMDGDVHSVYNGDTIGRTVAATIDSAHDGRDGVTVLASDLTLLTKTRQRPQL